MTETGEEARTTIHVGREKQRNDPAELKKEDLVVKMVEQFLKVLSYSTRFYPKIENEDKNVAK